MDDNPLLEFLTDTFKSFPEGIKRASTIGTVNANNGAYKTWNIDEIPHENVVSDAPHQCISSASLPGLFIPTVIGDGVYIDGGTAMGLDAITAVERCLAMTESGKQEDVTLDIMLLDRFVAPPDHQKDGDTI